MSIIALLVIIAVGTAGIYSRFGGFGTGECADTEEFKKYATNVSALTVPDEAQIVALGEATHGNKEFQQLRLDVLQILVEKYGVRSFALEGDFGGCEAVNRYIHGGDGTVAEALAATGFAIYCTEEMDSLVEWMRDYNASVTQGEDLRFYGFDMEQRAYSYWYLLEALQKAGIDTADFEKMWNSEAGTYADSYFAIGTDFYKSVCNLPKPYTGERITHTFYSHDPLAKASKQCGFAVSFLDFSKVPGDSPLAEYISSSIPMGSLGESYSALMNFVPRSYRVFRTPQQAHDAMIFVADAAPIEISPVIGE